MSNVIEVCNRAKNKLTPSPRQRQFVESTAEEIRQRVKRECDNSHLEAEVRLDGSIAKDTWIPDNVDADVFMRVSPKLTKEDLRRICLPVARRALHPNEAIERFAEHPYVESILKSPKGQLRVNVVPCYEVQKGEWLSATDRTPFHTDYIRGHLTPEQRGEVRLLKAFLRSIGSYGADIKTGGFSGMLSETLIAAHKDFLAVIRDFVGWQENRFVDIERFYVERENEVKKIFREPLIVIDPVDKGRNLGAAVRPEQLWNFVAACRHFLERPSPSFFKERKVRPLTTAEYRRQIRNRGSTLLCLPMGGIDAVVDILWSQLYKTQRAIMHFLQNNDFQVIRSAAWSDEHALNILLFELASEEIAAPRRHQGPPVSKINESLAFLNKHNGRDNTLSGPWIENESWIVETRRITVSATALLQATLKNGGGSIGVASLTQRAFKRKLVILKDTDLLKLINANQEFSKFLRTYLTGRPTWIA